MTSQEPDIPLQEPDGPFELKDDDDDDHPDNESEAAVSEEYPISEEEQEEGDEEYKKDLDEDVTELRSEVNEKSTEKNEEDGGVESETGEDTGEECVYKNIKKNEEVDEVDENDELDLIEDADDIIDESTQDDNVIVLPEERITMPYLTKYERVRILGDRTKQLSLGAKPMIKGVSNMTPKQIALLELEYKVMPLIIRRPRPDGKKEIWKLKELELVN